MGPAIVARLSATSEAALTALITEGLPAKGMPGVALSAPDLRDLLSFLRTLSAPERRRLPRVRVETVDGVTLDGVALNQSSTDLQLLSDDGRLHLLRPHGPSVSARQLRRATGPAITGRPPATGSVRSIRSAAATSRGWRRRGCSRCLAPNACRSRPSSLTA